MFKLPKPEDVDAMIEQYKILEATHQKVSQAGQTRSNGCGHRMRLSPALIY